MKLLVTHHVFCDTDEVFTEQTAPDWLTGANRTPGSTMDVSWFWVEQVLTLEVGESVETDFHTIKRVE